MNKFLKLKKWQSIKLPRQPICTESSANVNKEVNKSKKNIDLLTQNVNIIIKKNSMQLPARRPNKEETIPCEGLRT